MKRDYLKQDVDIDGRTIPYRIFTVRSYFEEKGYTEKQIDKLCDNWYEMYQMINQVIALKQSCFLLRHTSHSCGSLAEDLYQLKLRLIKELKDNYNFDFDEDMMENDGTDYLY